MKGTTRRPRGRARWRCNIVVIWKLTQNRFTQTDSQVHGGTIPRRALRLKRYHFNLEKKNHALGVRYNELIILLKK